MSYKYNRCERCKTNGVMINKWRAGIKICSYCQEADKDSEARKETLKRACITCEEPKRIVTQTRWNDGYKICYYCEKAKKKMASI